MGEKKGGSVVTENPKGGIAENFGRIQRGEPLKCAWKMKTYGGGGGGRETFKGRDWLNFTLFSLKSFAPPLPPPGDK